MATVTIEELLQVLVENGGSDLHLSAGAPPKVRIDGELVDTEYEVLRGDDTKNLVYSFLTGDQIARFERDYEIDLSFGVDGLGRFRVNTFFQRGTVGAVLRVIPYNVKTFEQLGLPRVICEEIAALPRGLVLFTGATASLKARPPFAPFASAKFALRGLAQALARDWGPKGVHVAHVVVDGAIGGEKIKRGLPQVAARLGEEGMVGLAGLADVYWALHAQPRTAWTHELDVRTWKESW